ncbi:MAG TPA: nuclear transport factor 2 family protein [Ilumatobacteraceae bacterium]|nr:nuclear transport factor 2 family protein [Ilumatobacteraceae bacterium]
MSQSDESALLALSLEYADAVRARDEARWSATWADDARWVLGEGRDVVGRDALVAMWGASLARYAVVVQIYSGCVFDIDGDTATGRCEFQELNVVADGSRRIMAGRYDDTYGRTPEGWRFTSRRLTKYYQGPPDLTGEFFAP